MKAVLKNIFKQGSYLYNLFSFAYHWKKNYWQPKKYNDLHALLCVYASTNSKVSFIQVGANDGISNDPLNQFIEDFNWSGICVEPVPANFHKLTKTYSRKSNIALINAAVGSDGKQKIYFVNPSKAKALHIEIPAWYEQLASFDKDLVVSDIAGERKAEIVDEIDIRSVSFETLIKDYDCKKIDLLHIDTEGADWLILSSFPFTKFKPDIILFEHNHLGESDYKSANTVLKANGYTLVKVETDTFCYHKRVTANFKKIMNDAYWIG